MRSPHYFDIHPENLTSSVTRDPCYLYSFFFFVGPEHFLFVPSGPFFAGLHRPRSKVRNVFTRLGGAAGGGKAAAPPAAEPSLARTFTLARCAAGAPQVTKFRELRDFYGCPPKVEPGVSQEPLGWR